MQIAYKRLEIWKLSYDLVLEIYRLLEGFPNFENDNIKYQLRRAVTSLPLNIAEGSGASSPRLFLNYLTFAYRSSREIETLLLLSKDLKYLDDKKYNNISNQLDFFYEEALHSNEILGKRVR
jgi:four helix bundle protein